MILRPDTISAGESSQRTAQAVNCFSCQSTLRSPITRFDSSPGTRFSRSHASTYKRRIAETSEKTMLSIPSSMSSAFIMTPQPFRKRSHRAQVFGMQGIACSSTRDPHQGQRVGQRKQNRQGSLRLVCCTPPSSGHQLPLVRSSRLFLHEQVDGELRAVAVGDHNVYVANFNVSHVVNFGDGSANGTVVVVVNVRGESY